MGDEYDSSIEISDVDTASDSSSDISDTSIEITDNVSEDALDDSFETTDDVPEDIVEDVSLDDNTSDEIFIDEVEEDNDNGFEGANGENDELDEISEDIPLDNGIDNDETDEIDDIPEDISADSFLEEESNEIDENEDYEERDDSEFVENEDIGGDELPEGKDIMDISEDVATEGDIADNHEVIQEYLENEDSPAVASDDNINFAEDESVDGANVLTEVLVDKDSEEAIDTETEDADENETIADDTLTDVGDTSNNFAEDQQNVRNEELDDSKVGGNTNFYDSQQVDAEDRLEENTEDTTNIDHSTNDADIIYENGVPNEGKLLNAESVEETSENSHSEKIEGVNSLDTMTAEDAERKISEYYGQHDYSPGDYETYSQDPEWRNLMRKAYPEVELPELALSQEEAINKIPEYYGKHDYSPSDYDTYSQDPEWRELMQKAYPETELPPLMTCEKDEGLFGFWKKGDEIKKELIYSTTPSREMIESQEYEQYRKIYDKLDSFDISQGYKDMLIGRFGEMDSTLKGEYNEYADKLVCLDASYLEYDDKGVPQDAAYFSPKEGGFKFSQECDLNNPLGSGNTFFHESGHMLDWLKGQKSDNVSHVCGMSDAIKQDYQDAILRIKGLHQCDEKTAQDLLSMELMEDPIASNCVSDVFGGISRNQVSGAWGHSTNYWMNRGPEAVGKEAFAEITADRACNNANSIAFTQKYMPKTIAAYNRALLMEDK